GKMKIRASVPAKVILFGEHFVVYNKRALATALNLRLSVEVTGNDKSGYHLYIENIPSFGFQMELAEGKAQPFINYAGASSAIAYVRGAIEYLESKYGIEGGVEMRIKSDIPLSAGLGSSAATSVATIAALRRYFGVDSGEPNLEEIREDAHHVEKAIQGNASPVDTAISAYGGYVMIENGEVKRLNLPAIDLIIGTIGCIPLGVSVERISELSLKTKKLVEAVKTRREAFKSVFEHIFNASDELTKEAILALEQRDFYRLGSLMNINHGLLDAIGVVPRRLSELVKLSQELGAPGAKVTGAGGLDELGGAGSVMALPPPGDSNGAIKIKTAMALTGALAMVLKTNAKGLIVESV
ncbi:MAG: mevalonate kinase, partial [Methanophagales archaeon]|nr:mevalonate kinase [Methanophagales archaeon]